jgi:hypothetical protein
LPQGLPKKIEFNLLLADLAFQLADVLARGRKILAWRKVGRPKALARPTRRPQRLRSAPPKMPAPLVQMPARNPKLPGECSGALPGYQPLGRRELELSAEHTSLSSGHRSPLENCPLFLCLILGVHSKEVSLFSLCYFVFGENYLTSNSLGVIARSCRKSPSFFLKISLFPAKKQGRLQTGRGSWSRRRLRATIKV